MYNVSLFSQVDLGTFACDLCNKKCKSKGRLKIHKNKKHGEENTKQQKGHTPDKSKKINIEIETLTKLVETACEKILADKLYPPEMLDMFSNFRCDISNRTALLLLQNEIQENVVFKNNETFYITFFPHVVERSSDFFNTDKSYIIARKFGEQLFRFWKETHSKNNIDGIITKSLSAKELDALNYLGGYVIRNLYAKHKKRSISKTSNNFEHQVSMDILLACRFDEEVSNSKLIKALSRGGLWSIKEETQKIFSVAEKTFLIQTHEEMKRNVNVSLMVTKLLSFAPLLEIFECILMMCDEKPSKDISKIVLRNILTLYLRIRTYSLARDIVQKNKVKVISKTKDAALRKKLKKNENDCL